MGLILPISQDKNDSFFSFTDICALPHTFTTKTCRNASISFAMSVHQHVKTKLLICDTAEFCLFEENCLLA
jgi:hypothetical protein